jgi:phenylacetate-CoA ligase
VDQAQYNAAVDFLRRSLAETEWYDAERLLAYHQLAQLLRFAAANVPFYRERLAPVLGADGAVDWNRWAEIPLIGREELKARGDEMLAPLLPPGHGDVHKQVSSGTTGSPVEVYCSTVMDIAGAAAFNRACAWYGASPRDRNCCTFSGPQIDALDPAHWCIGDAVFDHPDTKLPLAVNWSWPAERILELMRVHRSSNFVGSANTIDEFCDAPTELLEELHLHFLIGAYMAIPARARAMIPKLMKTQLYSAYSTAEATKIAHECPQASGGLHVNSELVYVEIIDDDGRPCPPGESGRVVVTPILNTAQPLIRYVQGDTATWGTPCPCGRAHTIIARIDGRLRHRFHFGGVRRFNPSIGFTPYLDILKADRWQVAQTGPMDIEVRFVTKAPDSAIDFPAMTDLYRKNFHDNVKVTYRRLDRIEPTPGGKYIDYVNEYEAGGGLA